MAETNVADALVEYLSSRGVENIFGVLAHTSFAIGDAIAKRPHMKFINAQHEGGAGNMALGYARATKKPAVCLVSAGGGTGEPRMLLSTHLPRSTGDVRLACEVTVRMLP